MGVAYFIALEGNAPGVDTTTGFQFLAIEQEDLDWIADETGVRRLSQFIRPAPDVGQSNRGEKFSLADGLKSIQMLRREIQAYPLPAVKKDSKQFIRAHSRDSRATLRSHSP